MVTPEERITRLEAIQEANSQQLALVLSRLDQVVNLIESVRLEARELNEIARQEAREEIRGLRQETREMNEASRKEAREDNEAVRKEARILFLSLLTLGAALFGTVLGTSLAG